MGAAAVAVVAGAIWLLIGDREPPSVKAEPHVLRPRAEEHVGEPADPAAEIDGFSGASAIALPGATPPEAVPLAVAPAAVPLPGPEHAFHGVVVRASDGSPVAGVTVVATEREVIRGRETELTRTLTAADGTFRLLTWRSVLSFYTLTAEEHVDFDGADQDGPAQSAPAATEWLMGDAGGGEVRLVMNTGWRLDLRVNDSEGQPREGVVVTAGDRTVTTDVQGQCALVDLPFSEESLTLSLAPRHTGRPLTHVVESPTAGHMRTELTLTVP